MSVCPRVVPAARRLLRVPASLGVGLPCLLLCAGRGSGRENSAGGGRGRTPGGRPCARSSPAARPCEPRPPRRVCGRGGSATPRPGPPCPLAPPRTRDQGPVSAVTARNPEAEAVSRPFIHLSAPGRLASQPGAALRTWRTRRARCAGPAGWGGDSTHLPPPRAAAAAGRACCRPRCSWWLVRSQAQRWAGAPGAAVWYTSLRAAGCP